MGKIEHLILNFINIYLNPRCNIDIFNKNKYYFAFEKMVIEEDDDFETSIYLNFLINKNVYDSQILKKDFLKHLSIVLPDLNEGIFSFINSLFHIIYLPINNVNYCNTLIDHKIRALYQLCFNLEYSEENDKARTFLIKHLLYNSYLYDELEFIYMNKGKLYLDKIYLVEFFSELRKNNLNSNLFNVSIDYCLLIIKFLENGIRSTDEFNKNLTLNDELAEISNYQNFIINDSNRITEIIKILSISINYPFNTNLNFINNLLIFNITNFIPNYKKYIQKGNLLTYIEENDNIINNYRLDI